jgi:hypothetical protein
MEARKWTVVGLFIAILAVALLGCANEAVWKQHEDQRKGMSSYPSYPYRSWGTEEKGMTLEQYQKELQAKTREAAEADARARQALAAKEEADRRAREAMIAKEKAEREARMLPASAKAGECYTRVFVPSRYQTIAERILARQASERVETIPAKYEVVEEKVLVRQASSRLEEVPAEYGWAEEKILVEPAHSAWKKGRGLIEKVDNATGEIMCLVEIPAKYETVRKRVVTKPATVRQVEIPAEYQTIKVTKMVSPPQEKRIPIPEEYETVTRTEKVADGYMEWRQVLCETNMSHELVTKVQQALSKEGFNPGAIDGTYGSQTRTAVTSYQKAKGLAEGELTYETMKSLGIKID